MKSGRRRKLVCIDPGHGGNDPGAVWGGVKEKLVTLELSYLIQNYLMQDYGIDARLTREADQYVSLEQRTAAANEMNADLFYSIHVNASGDGNASGYEDYIWKGLQDTSRTAVIRDTIHGFVRCQCLDSHRVVDRGRKKADFYVLRETTMPAILTENLFLDDEADYKRLNNRHFVKALARAHAMGIRQTLLG